MKHNLRNTRYEFRDTIFARHRYPKFCPTVVALLCITFIVWPFFWRVTLPVLQRSLFSLPLRQFSSQGAAVTQQEIKKRTLTSKLSRLITHQGNCRHAGCVVWVFIPHLFGLPYRIFGESFKRSPHWCVLFGGTRRGVSFFFHFL